MAERHVLIVGGGIVGLSTAWYLVRRGARVTVVERDRVVTGASAGNAGIVALGHLPLPWPGRARQAMRWLGDRDSPLYIRPRWDPALLRWLLAFHRACRAEWVDECMEIIAPLDRLSLRCWQEISAETGIDCGLTNSGWLEVYATPAGERQAAETAAVARRCGFAAEILAGEALRTREPAFTEAVRGAVYYPESYIVDPERFLVGLAASLREAGVTVRESTPVARLLTDGHRRRCRGAQLADGEVIDADAVVVAAGAWSAELAAAAGVKLPLQAAKGYHLDLVAPAPAVRCGCVLIESSVAVTPLGRRLRLAGTLEFSGVNLQLHRHRVDMLRRGAAPYFRGVADAAELAAWCGLRPCFADGLPVVDRATAWPGLFLATGHAKMGLTQGPGTGYLMAEWLLDGACSLPLGLLRADRF